MIFSYERGLINKLRQGASVVWKKTKKVATPTYQIAQYIFDLLKHPETKELVEDLSNMLHVKI